MNSKVLGWLSAIGSAFLGGAMGYGATHLDGAIPSTTAQWKATGLGALVAGAIAVAHLLQQSPLSGGGSGKVGPS